MDPNIESRLKAIELKVEENNHILVRMRRSQRTASAVRAFYWVAIIGLSFVSYYFIKPYLGQLGAAYGLSGSTTGEPTTTTGSSSDTLNYSDLVKQLKEFQATQ